MADPDSSKRAPDTRLRGGSEDSTTRRPQLGLFAKLPVPGEVKTRLSPPLTPEEASRVYAAFLEDMDRLPATLGDCDSTLFLTRNPDSGGDSLLPGWRHTWQAAGNLGTRLESALRELHTRGDRAIILGSDHPDLPADLIRHALAALADHDLVFGPTPDGGYYLIGTAGPQPDLLAGVEWSTSRTADQTEQRALDRGLRVARIGSWPDVDTWEDVIALADRLRRGAGVAPATARTIAPLLARYGTG